MAAAWDPPGAHGQGSTGERFYCGMHVFVICIYKLMRMVRKVQVSSGMNASSFYGRSLEHLPSS